MYNKDFKARNSYVRGGISIAFNVLLHTKSKQKVYNWFCVPTIFKNPLKSGFLIWNIFLQFMWGVFGYLSFQKQTYNGLLKDIGLQIMFNVHHVKCW